MHSTGQERAKVVGGQTVGDESHRECRGRRKLILAPSARLTNFQLVESGQFYYPPPRDVSSTGSQGPARDRSVPINRLIAS